VLWRPASAQQPTNHIGGYIGHSQTQRISCLLDSCLVLKKPTNSVNQGHVARGLQLLDSREAGLEAVQLGELVNEPVIRLVLCLSDEDEIQRFRIALHPARQLSVVLGDCDDLFKLSLKTTRTFHLCHIPSKHNAVSGKDRKSTRLNSSHVKISYAAF